MPLLWNLMIFLWLPMWTLRRNPKLLWNCWTWIDYRWARSAPETTSSHPRNHGLALSTWWAAIQIDSFRRRWRPTYTICSTWTRIINNLHSNCSNVNNNAVNLRVYSLFLFLVTPSMLTSKEEQNNQKYFTLL